MPRWAVVRSMIQESIGPLLGSSGFVHFPESSDRYHMIYGRERDPFVDLITFGIRPGDSFESFGVELATGLKAFLQHPPQPWHCHFRTTINRELTDDGSLLKADDDADVQRRCISLIAPRVVAASDRWLAAFPDPPSVRKILLNWDDVSGRYGAFRKDSPIWREALQQIDSM